MANTTNNIQMNISDKTRYTINGNKEKYIELNTGDVGIIARMGEVIPTINGLVDKYENLIGNTDDEQDFMAFSKAFSDIDKELRDVTNLLFDYDVCSVCASGGSMLDMCNGEYRFTEIITTLISMYQDTISAEAKKLISKMKKHTDKYTTQDHQKKKG